MLGAADAEILFDTTDALAAGDGAAALRSVERLARSGRDPGQFARDLIAHLRQLLVARATGDVPESFTVTVSQPDRLAAQAKAIGDATLMGGIDALSVAVANMREGDDPRLSLEVALLKVAQPSLDSSREALLRRIESLEGALNAGASGGGGDDSAGDTSVSTPGEASAPPPPAEPPEPSPEEPDPSKGPAARAQTAVGAAVEKAEAAVEKGQAAVTAVDVERVTQLWPAVVEHVRDSGAEMLSTLFDGARPLAVESEKSVLRIGFPSSAKFNKRKAEAQANVERITESVKAVIGERLRPVYELVDGDEEAGPAVESGATAMAEEEIIELLKTKFDASEVLDEGRGEETA